MKTKESRAALLFLLGLTAAAVLLLVNLTGFSFGPTGAQCAVPQKVTRALLPAALRRNPARPAALGTSAPPPLLAQAEDFIGAFEPAVNQALDKSHLFIQLYGGIQHLSGRRIVEDIDPEYTVVKLRDGSLDFVNLDATLADKTPQAQAIVDFRDVLAEEFELPLLYIQAPQKSAPNALPMGVTNYGNQHADQILSLLEADGVDTLDLRPILAAAAAQPETPPLFFHTDHHWTPEGAFWGYQALCDRLRQDYHYEIPAPYTDPQRFTKTVYQDFFLGSQGKRVGSLYAGLDDITLWKPDFPTQFTYSIPLYDMERKGSFAQSLLFQERLEKKDFFEGNPYTLYAGGDYSLARIQNHMNPDGPRIMLLRDSYACAMTPFLALSCSELITVDLRYFHDDLREYLDWLEPDMVLVMYGASSTRIDSLFDFFPATAETKGSPGTMGEPLK